MPQRQLPLAYSPPPRRLTRVRLGCELDKSTIGSVRRVDWRPARRRRRDRCCASASDCCCSNAVVSTFAGGGGEPAPPPPNINRSAIAKLDAYAWRDQHGTPQACALHQSSCFWFR